MLGPSKSLSKFGGLSLNYDKFFKIVVINNELKKLS